MALVKYNNNSISNVTTTALAEGSLVPIKTLTASSSSTLSFVDGTDGVVLDNTYPIYKFEFINIHPATDTAKLTFQSSTNGGSSYGVTATSSSFRAYHDESDVDPYVGYDSSQDLAQSTSFASLGRFEGNDNDQNAGGHLTLFNSASSTFVKHWLTVYTESFASDYTNTTFTAGYFNSTNPINAIQFKYSSGNIDSGKIKLYGIKDS
jgi:hypothetical protein